MMLGKAEVLEAFRELPGHRGCTARELDDIESQLGVSLPQQYREMMQLDASRLAGAGIVEPIARLVELRRDAADLLIEDVHQFRLGEDDVVFAWDDIYAFYFFKADGSIDPPVRMFNYYDSGNNWTAVMVADTLTTYLADALRRYLKLT